MKKLNRWLLIGLMISLFTGCGGGSGDENPDDSKENSITHSSGECLPLIIELLQSSQGINEYKVTTNVEDNLVEVYVDLRANEAVWTGPTKADGDRQISWQVSAIEKDATLYFTRSDSGCTEIVTLKGFGPYVTNYDGIYRGNVTSNCESTVSAVLNVNDNIITGSTSDGYDVIGYRIEGNKVTGISDDGITWDGVMIEGGQIMSGSWSDGEGCHGDFRLNKS